MPTITVKDGINGIRSYRIFQTSRPGPLQESLWFENEDGEGMEITQKEIFDILDKKFLREISNA